MELRTENERLGTSLASAMFKLARLEEEAAVLRQHEAAFLRAIVSTAQVIAQKSDACCSYIESTSKLEGDLHRARETENKNAVAQAALFTETTRLNMELTAAKASCTTSDQTTTAATAEIKAVKSSLSVAEARIQAMQQRLDEAVFESQRDAERIVAGEVAASLLQKAHAALQKKHEALLSAIVSETTLKRKREQQQRQLPPPVQTAALLESHSSHLNTSDAATDGRALTLLRPGPQQPQRKGSHGSEAASRGSGSSVASAKAAPPAPGARTLSVAESDAWGSAGGWKGGVGTPLGTSKSSSSARPGVSVTSNPAAAPPRDCAIELSPLDDDSPVQTLKKPRSRYTPH